MPLLQVTGLEKWYGRRKVVNGVDYEVDQGEVVGLLGLTAPARRQASG